MAKKIAKYKGFAEKNDKFLLRITYIFVLSILCLFPLYYNNYYFDILKVKYYYYCINFFALLFVFMISLSSILYFDRNNYNGLYLAEQKKRWKLLNCDKALLCFFVICVISTIQSDYKWEAFWGNEGRFSGLFLISMYVISFFIVSKNFKFKTLVFELFLVSGMLVCLFGITDYFRIDLLHFKELMKESEKNMFTATMGNINTYTAYVALVMGVATTLFATAQQGIKKIWYFICMTITFFAIIMGVSDNAYLAIGALFVLLPIAAFRNKQGFKSYLISVATFFSVVQCIDWIVQKLGDQTVPLDGIFQLLVGYHRLAAIVICLWILVGLSYAVDFFVKDKLKYSGKKVCIGWAILVGILFFTFIYTLIDANTNEDLTKYGRYANYLILNDTWGTHRGYIWRIAIENYMKFPLIHKIFGYGPETFGIVTVMNNRHEMIQTYDNAHNEYLQYLITIGPLGLISYLWFLISSGIRIFKKGLNKPYIISVLFAVVCYSAQALVNLNLPIVAPIMWTLLMVGVASCREEA